MESAEGPEQNGATASHPLSHCTRLLPVRAEATGPRGNALLPPPPAQSPPVGPRRRRAGALRSARALPAPSPGPARQRRTLDAMPARHSFQEELSVKRSEIPSENLLRGGSPYLLGAQEPRQGCQEKQLGRRRRRRHPGPPRAGPAAPPPRRPAAQQAGERAPPRRPLAPARPRRPPARLRRSAPPPAPDRQRGLPRPARPSPRLRPAPTPAHSGGPCAHAS